MNKGELTLGLLLAGVVAWIIIVFIRDAVVLILRNKRETGRWRG